MSRNPLTCPHNIRDIDPDTKELWCTECGIVLEDMDDEEDF